MAAQELTPFGSALSGALGSIFANAAVYPLDTVKTRLQALPSEQRPDSNDSSSLLEKAKEVKPPRDVKEAKALSKGLLNRLKRWEMLQMLLRIIKTEGLAGVFKGFSANMINTFSQQFAYFFFHSSLRTALLARLATALSTPQELALGALAGALAQIFTIPVSVIALRQQIADHKESPKSLLQVGNEIVQESGWTGLWTGLKPGLVLTVNPAITYGVFERVKAVVLAREGRVGGRLTVGESFWIGVGSKTLATVVTYPYIFAKVRLQAQSKSKSSPAATTSFNPTHAPETSQAQSETQSSLTESYAEIASHTPAPDAPIIPAHLHQQGDIEKAQSAVQDSLAQKGQGRGNGRGEGGGGGAIALLAKVYREKGLAGWYKGLGAQIVKAVLCQGILFVSKDQFESYTILLLALIARLRSRIPLARLGLKQVAQVAQVHATLSK